MPQHLWVKDRKTSRHCEVCDIRQTWKGSRWVPETSAICKGDNDDSGHAVRPPHVLEDA